MKTVAMIIFITYACSVNAKVLFSVHPHSDGKGPSVDKVTEAISTFASHVKRNCDIELEYDVVADSTLSYLPSEYQIEILPEQKHIGGEHNYYKYFQAELAQIVHNNALKRDVNEIKIVIVENFDGYCGYAFPEIQFDFGEGHEQNPLTQKLKNHVLINTSQFGCGGFNRLLSHELGHIFIQDNPAHMCEENGNTFKCKENNLLSVNRVIRSNPFNHGGTKNGGKYGKPGGFGSMPNPFEVKKLPSLGTGLLSSQCEAIKNTIKDLE